MTENNQKTQHDHLERSCSGGTLVLLLVVPACLAKCDCGEDNLCREPHAGQHDENSTPDANVERNLPVDHPHTNHLGSQGADDGYIMQMASNDV